VCRVRAEPNQAQSQSGSKLQEGDHDSEIALAACFGIRRPGDNISAAASPVEGATPPVHTSGPPWCVNPDGTGGCYSRIQDAINAASSGIVIDVAAGTYTEHITMRDGISIYGQGWSSTTIHGGYAGPTPTVYMSSIWAGTVLSGVQVTGGGTGVTTRLRRMAVASPSGMLRRPSSTPGCRVAQPGTAAACSSAIARPRSTTCPPG